MQETTVSREDLVPSFRSGAAARLAGIPVATLRMWERRYRVVGPRTSSHGHRRYGPEDVTRLALIKALVDQGHAIGTLARLPLGALRALQSGSRSASQAAAAPTAVAPAPLKVAIVGASMAAGAAASAHRFPSLQIVASCADAAQACAALRGARVDLLVIELPSLREDAVALVDTLVEAAGARRALVAYRFGAAAALDAMRGRGHAVAHAPIGLAEIESIGAAALGLAPTAAAPPRPVPTAPRFDEETLARLAQISTSVRCECPRNVVDLLLSLGAFERYSAECENRSPADAELHRYLASVAGSARALFEDALVRVAQAEGIALPPAP